MRYLRVGVEVNESEDVKPVKSGQDEQTAGALCIKNVVVEGVERHGAREWAVGGAWERAQCPSA
jgi:hypothetical protein